MSIQARHGAGYSTALPTDAFMVGRKIGYTPAGGMPLAVYCHSAGSNATEPHNAASATAASKLFASIIEAGFMLVSADTTGPSWANDTALDLVEELIVWARANGANKAPPVMVGGSMGGAVAMGRARRHPDDVAALLLLGPASDIEDIRAFNRGGLTAQINTAFGGAYSDVTHGPTHNPALFASQLARIPGQIWASDDDTIVMPATVARLAASWGDRCDYRHGAWGPHGADTNFSNVSIPAVLDFLAARGT